jgi:hypothetical protein
LYIERQQFAHEFRYAITDVGRPTRFDDDRLPLDIAQLPQPLPKGVKELRSLGRTDGDPSDPRHRCGLLRASASTEKLEEFAPSHEVFQVQPPGLSG